MERNEMLVWDADVEEVVSKLRRECWVTLAGEHLLDTNMKLSPSMCLSPGCWCAHTSTRRRPPGELEAQTGRCWRHLCFPNTERNVAVLTWQRDGEETKLACSFHLETHTQHRQVKTRPTNWCSVKTECIWTALFVCFSAIRDLCVSIRKAPVEGHVGRITVLLIL